LEQELGWDPRDPRIGWPKNPGTIWVNYPNIALKNPYFRSVNYYNLPRMFINMALRRPNRQNLVKKYQTVGAKTAAISRGVPGVQVWFSIEKI
jgi:hypothetical protein